MSPHSESHYLVCSNYSKLKIQQTEHEIYLQSNHKNNTNNITFGFGIFFFKYLPLVTYCQECWENHDAPCDIPH